VNNGFLHLRGSFTRPPTSLINNTQKATIGVSSPVVFFELDEESELEEDDEDDELDEVDPRAASGSPTCAGSAASSASPPAIAGEQQQ
jgi:hypothetical protein